MKAQRGLIVTLAAVALTLLTAWLTPPLHGGRGGAALASALPVTKPAPVMPTAAQGTKQIKLVVRVKGLDGKFVVGAAVTVWHDTVGPELRSSDYQGETNGQGVAVINVAATGGSVIIKAIRGDLRGEGTAKLIGTQVNTVISVEPRDDGIFESGVQLFYLKVHVERETGGPLEGASVEIRENEGGPRTYTGVTGRDGDATVTVRFVVNKYSIEASKSGFETVKVGIEVPIEQAGQTIVAPKIRLNKTPGVEVTIKVLSDEDSKPVPEATVELAGSGWQVYRATTDSQGRASIFVREYGQYRVKVSQGFYHPYNGEVLLVRAREQSLLDITLKEKPKADTSDEFVKVRVLAGDKKSAPIVGASVRLGNKSVTTDAEGLAILNTAFGDATHVVVTATAAGYKRESKSLPVRRGVRYTDAGASATIILQPGEDALPDDTPITLVVEVRDSFDLKPIKDAGVGFFEVDGAFLIGGYTDDEGEHDFKSGDVSDKPLSVLRRGLKLDIRKTGYKKQEGILVSADLLKPLAEPRKFSVALEREWTELRAAAAALEGRIAAWDKDVRLVAEKGASVKRLVREASAAEARARELSGELGNGIVLNDVPGRLSGETICRRAGELRQSIQRDELEALAKEESVKRLLDNAARVAASCKSPREANAVKSDYASALKLSAEIGALVNKARRANEQLSRVSGELKGRLTTPDIESKLNELVGLSRAADRAAINAEVDERRGTGLSRSLSGRHAALTGELAALRTAHGINSSGTGLPADLKQQLENMAALLGSRNNEVMAGPDPNGPGRVKAAAENIQTIKAEAERALSQLKNTVTQCEVAPLDEALERMGNAIVSATVELSAAANLTAKADECSMHGACQPLLGEVRALLELDDLEAAAARINQARTQSCDVSESEKELEYWRMVRQTANLIAGSLDSCRFQEALNLSQQIPPSIKSRPLVAEALEAARRGLQARQRIRQLREDAERDVTRTNQVAAAHPYIAQAEQAAEGITCLVEEVGRFRAKYQITGLIHRPTLAEVLPDNNDQPTGTAVSRPVTRPQVEEFPEETDRPVATTGAGRQPEVKTTSEEAESNPTSASDTSKPQAAEGSLCTVAGSWQQYAQDVGGSTWNVTDDGAATEEGLGEATGTATLSGNVMRIVWSSSSGYSGTYEWTMDKGCKSGTGTLLFKSGGRGERRSTVTHTK